MKLTEKYIDEAAGIRPGEALDLAALREYLRDPLQLPAAPLEVRQFRGGFSNLTYLLRAGEREWVLRRPPFGANIQTAHDMHREFRVLSHLKTVYEKVPQPVVYCDDESVIGAPFYVMERVKGLILRSPLPRGLHLPPQTMHRAADALIDALADLHAVDYGAAGLGDLGKPDGYVTRQIHGWIRRYENARTDSIPQMTEVGAWLAQHIPAESAPALIHNDFKYDNLVLDPADPGRIIAVLDWEMATIGDPLMDLGTTLGYWIEPGDPDILQMFGPSARPGNPGRQELLDRYRQRSGREIPNALFYYVYGVFKIAVIVQQIYYRYKSGATRDPRFAPLIRVVQACAQTAAAAVAKNRISGLT